jgi:tetratricopeptide (TPR) repeat protein
MTARRRKQGNRPFCYFRSLFLFPPRRSQDALVEYCAVLVADTVEMRTRLAPFADHPQLFAQQQQKILEEKGADAQATQEKLQETMQLCGKAKADAVLAAREKAGGLPHTGNITSESSVFQLLLSYTEYLDQEASSRAADLASLTKDVVAANSSTAAVSSDDSDSSRSLSSSALEAVRPKLAALQARALHFMAKRQYAKASDDLMAAFAAFEGASAADAGGGAPPLGGEAAVECAALLRWVALFHHVRYDLTGALAVYARAAELAASHPAALATVEVMRSGVHVDLGSLPDAEAALTRAAALAPTSVDVLMHRSQLWLLTPDLDKSEVDIRACLAARPTHAVAQLRLAMMLLSQAQTLAQGGHVAQAEGKLQEAHDAVGVAKASRPNMSEVFQVLGSIKEVKGDVEGAMAAHDKAIALDPKNPTPYINKGEAKSSPRKTQSLPHARALALWS